jgi:type I restriction enzyme M protein
MIDYKTNSELIIKLLKALDFKPTDGTTLVYSKKYLTHKNYLIEVDFEKESINYGNKIKVGDKTTSNFKVNENFIVLECVNRLLEKGYAPESITLEKDYPLGHKNKGKLDILVTDKEGKSYLMIECKTWGIEYDKARKKTLSDGGQLLSYFQQDKSSKYLALYTSKIENNSITYKNGIIKVEGDFSQATNTKEVFEIWNKNLKDNGIFEKWVTPYNITIKAITKGSLNPLTKEDSSRIFNQFAEILRHNVVSDKPNAFNKLITLLLCKIVDEDKANNEELHFQWLENDTDIDLQKRLNDLYKTGMQKYLTKVVTDYSDSDVEEIVGLNEKQKDIIKKMMTELRLKKNNEFAFKEVYNNASFIENGKVLKEVVELLQPYQVRYNKKQQFLGDFFELLLNTSIKQEAGQFFTPVPIARFIISSIPLRKIILDKIKNDDPEFLPYVIDYAVGSGHFLTEAMDEIHNAIVDFNDSGDFKQSVKKKLSGWADNAAFDWAYSFVYGIEKDYRLVKTAKVSCFLNGDGLARIFNADGLGNFDTDTDYKDKLKITSKTDPKDNQEFDVLIANPPYSVSAFKNTLINGDKSFELYNRLTDDSSEIECLFIERTKQLLKENGYAGIILPSSILNNAGIYSDAREILLKYFKIVAITEFGSNTFMATGTNTVTLFLHRRNNSDWLKVQNTVNNFFKSPVDVTCNGVEMPFSKYVAHVYKNISLKDYISLVNKNPNEKVKENELYKDYQKEFNDSTFIKNLLKKPIFKIKTADEQQEELERLFYLEVFTKEREKLLFFILAYPQKTLLIKSNPDGKNETEREFLGYEFSNRRGHEGIKPYGAKTIQETTKLYDEKNLLNPNKVNSYIQSAFIGNEITINENLKSHISQQNLVDLMQWDRVTFEKSISLSIKKEIKIESKWDIVKLSQLVDIVRGASPRPIDQYITNDIKGVNWIKIGDISSNSKYIRSTKEKITKEGAEKSRYVHKGDFILSNSMSFGRPYILDITGCIHDGWLLLTGFNESLNKDYLYNILSSNIVQEQFKNEAQGGTTVDNLNIEKVSSVVIPLPPKNIQEKIIKEITIVENLEHKAKEKVDGFQLRISTLFNEVESKASTKLRLSDNSIFDISIGQRVLKNELLPKGEVPVYSANVFEPFGYVNRYLIEDFSKASVLWGIDGDWMVNYIPQNISFYPTDHCGVLRVKNNMVNERYLAYILQKEGEAVEFSRNKRASIDRIQGLKIPFPSIEDQQKAVSEIEKLEKEIKKLQEIIKNVNLEKERILEKYL